MIPSIRALWADVPTDGPAMTVANLLALPEDRWRFELIAGHLRRRDHGDLRHAMIESALLQAVRESIRNGGLSGVTVVESGFVVSGSGEPDTVLVPALAFVRTDHTEDGVTPTAESAIRRIPDLVAEIAAPSQPPREMSERAQRWLSLGTCVVWVIWPARHRVDVWRRTEADDATPTTYSVQETLVEREVLPDFSYPVSRLFI